jgi:hypothetical protein
MPEAGTTQTSVASSYLAGLVFVCLGISEKLAILPAHHQSRSPSDRVAGLAKRGGLYVCDVYLRKELRAAPAAYYRHR